MDLEQRVSLLENKFREQEDSSTLPLAFENAIRARIRQPLFGSKQIDFGSVSTDSSATDTISVIGAESGDPVVLGIPSLNENAGCFYTTWVSSPGVVSIRFNNESGSSVDLPSGFYRVAVLKQ